MTMDIYSSGPTETQSTVQQVKEKAGETVEQVQQKAKELAGQAQTQAKSMATTRKDQAVEGLSQVAEAIRATGNELRYQDHSAVAQYSEQVAEQVDRVAQYLGNRDINQLLAEAEDFARRQPQLFLGGAFMVGLLVGRFIKSSRERADFDQGEGMRGYHQSYWRDYTSSDPTRFNQPGAPEGQPYRPVA